MSAHDFDPLQLEIENHRLAAIAEEMGETLMRAAFSANIKERRDFSCALFDRQGRMLAQAAHIPVHLGSAPLSVVAIIDAVALGPGEVGIVNDPFAGGTHLPDITVVTPVYVGDADAPTFYVANRAHHADVGGTSPGSMPIASHIDDEGFRIAPQRLTEALENEFLAAVRSPDERRGDLRAQRAANEVGARRLREWVEQSGSAESLARVRSLFAWSSRLMADVIRSLPVGEFTFEDVLDSDGLGATNLPIRAAVQVRPNGTLLVDFRGTAPQTAGPVNAVRAIALSAVHYVLRCLAPEGLPSNDGFMELVEVVTEPGSLVDAQPPAAVSAGNVETSQRIVDVLIGALSKAAPERLPAASCGSMSNFLFGGIREDGTEFTYYETIGGGSGATSQTHGASGVQTHMTNTLNTPIEALEHAVPVRVREYGLRAGTGGSGKHRGGEGIVRRYEFLSEAEVTIVAERRSSAPWGLAGGEPGALGSDWLTRVDSTGRRVRQPLVSKSTFRVGPGDEVEIGTPGGGGHGEVTQPPAGSTRTSSRRPQYAADAEPEES